MQIDSYILREAAFLKHFCKDLELGVLNALFNIKSYFFRQKELLFYCLPIGGG